MKRMLMAVMAVAVAVTFSAPAFAEEKPKEGGKKKEGHVVVYGEERKKQDSSKADETFGDKPAEEKKAPAPKK